MAELIEYSPKKIKSRDGNNFSTHKLSFKEEHGWVLKVGIFSYLTVDELRNIIKFLEKINKNLGGL